MPQNDKSLKEIRKVFDQSGNLIEDAEFVDNKRNGMTRLWYPPNILIGKAEYKDGLLNGLSQTWYREGQLHCESHYLHNELHGPYRSLWPNGKIKEMGEYKDGKRLKGYKWFDQDGNLVSKK